MFRRIMVPADLTERNRFAVDVAAGLAEQSGGVVFLLHVIEPIPGFVFEEDRDFYQKLEVAAEEHLERLGERLETGGIQWEAQVIYGSRASEIVRRAVEVEADLIVVKSHRVNLEKPTDWDSLSHQLGIFSQCPVLLIK